MEKQCRSRGALQLIEEEEKNNLEISGISYLGARTEISTAACTGRKQQKTVFLRDNSIWTHKALWENVFQVVFVFWASQKNAKKTEEEIIKELCFLAKSLDWLLDVFQFVFQYGFEQKQNTCRSDSCSLKWAWWNTVGRGTFRCEEKQWVAALFSFEKTRFGECTHNGGGARSREELLKWFIGNEDLKWRSNIEDRTSRGKFLMSKLGQSTASHQIQKG